MSTQNNSAPDLAQHPPRSPRVRLGGYVLLPRMLDKGRAEIAGTNGEYHYNCPLDQRLLAFLDLDAATLRQELATGKGDGEILEWITANAKNKHTPWEVAQWSAFHENRGPSSDEETWQMFGEMVGAVSKTREDITTWAAMLDLDDYVSFGGKA
ncbi:MAG: DUF5069 domain-containing protein [Chthoniobacteraceae bacterium]